MLLVGGLVLVGGFLLLNIVELPYADEETIDLFEMPHELQQYQDDFQKTCEGSELGCKQYLNPRIVSDLDTGRMRPKQKMRVVRQGLDTLQEKMDAFPSPEKKMEAMQNIANRIAIYKDKT